MILSRIFFKYHDFTLIEKVKIKIPFRYETTFQDEGCFFKPPVIPFIFMTMAVINIIAERKIKGMNKSVATI